MKIQMIFGLISCTLMATIMQNPMRVNADTPIPMGTNRKPLTCPSRKSPTKGAPSLAQAKKYFTCLAEQEIYGSMNRLHILVLIDDLNMQISPKPRKFSKAIDGEFIYDIGEFKLDTDKPVYPIQGSYTRYSCNDASYLKPGENCEIEKYNQNQGFCFNNAFGDWHCIMKGSPDRNSTRKGAPPQSNSSRSIDPKPAPALAQSRTRQICNKLNKESSEIVVALGYQDGLSVGWFKTKFGQCINLKAHPIHGIPTHFQGRVPFLETPRWFGDKSRSFCTSSQGFQINSAGRCLNGAKLEPFGTIGSGIDLTYESIEWLK
jgi:Protein of unknown function (DUF1036)